MEKLNVVVKLLEEKDFKEIKECFDKTLKERDLEDTNSNDKVNQVKGIELDNKTSDKQDGNKFKCDLCDFQSNSKQGLKTHISRKHTNYNEEALSIKCDVCTREFKCSKEFKKHMICHSFTDSSILNYKCDECDFW